MATRGAHRTEQLEAPEDALVEGGRAERLVSNGHVLPLPADTPEEPRRGCCGESTLEELIVVDGGAAARQLATVDGFEGGRQGCR